jgi:hypothetical protein
MSWKEHPGAEAPHRWLAPALPDALAARWGSDSQDEEPIDDEMSM